MISTTAPARVLYVVYWGALEPLGRSLVVPTVLRLAKTGVKLTLITFEKPADLLNAKALRELRHEFEAAGVQWRPLRYHKAPKWPATALDSVLAILEALRLRMSQKFDIVHARTFVAGPMGFMIASLLGARFVYHNEGFYPDEQVDGGVWRERSLVHRLAKRVEAFLYERADGIVVLSERAGAVLRSERRAAERTRIVVVPSAVDLQAFQPVGPTTATKGGLSLVYLGSVGLRYRLDQAGRFVNAVQSHRPGTTLTVISRADRTMVEAMLDAAGLPREAWSLRELPHSEIPAELRKHHAGLFFLTEGLSEHGCSPTKIGEYWAAGLPVVTTPNVSDTDATVRDQAVGVVVRGTDEAALNPAALQLIELVSDRGLPARCRRAAETVYSLEAACRRQADLYAELAQ